MKVLLIKMLIISEYVRIQQKEKVISAKDRMTRQKRESKKPIWFI